MSEIMLNVRDARRAVHQTCHASRTDFLVAALSADPETIEDLQQALARFMPASSAKSFFASWHSGTRDDAWDSGICIIDLAARLVAIQSIYSLPGSRGSVVVEGEGGEQGRAVRYHLAEDWLFLPEVDNWESTANERRRKRLAAPPFDARAVLYGGVCEFIAQSAPNEGDAGEAISAIHAQWLTAPRADLGGLAPRDVLLSQRSHLSWDLQDRSEQWSLLGACPPGLSQAAAAYRYGGFGTHEIVMYYKLLRFLLHAWCERLERTQEKPTAGESAAEVSWLEFLRDEWLETPDYEDLHGRTPASVIARERARLPEGISGTEAVVDHDCPMCQMMAELPGPMFWHLDGCNMDDEFAFSFHRTLEEWEAEQREYEEFSKRMDEKRHSEPAETDPVWKRSYVNEESLGQSPAMALLGLGTHLAELTQGLKDACAEEEVIGQLHRAFGNVRDAVESSADALIEPVIARMCESLADLAQIYPGLADKCADLERQLSALNCRFTDEELPF